MQRRPIIVLAAIPLLLPTASAEAAILGFDNFANFTINQKDGAAAPVLIPSQEKIQLTNNTNVLGRSIFYDTPQDIRNFTASFTYQVTHGTEGGYGAAFVIQNSNNGKNTVDGGFGAGIIGYADSFDHSAAVSLELSLGTSSSGFYTNGNFGGGASETAPLNSFSGNPIAVTITYDGLLLHQSLTDTVTHAMYEAFYQADLPAIMGSDTAYIGFTAGGGYFGGNSRQFFSDFRFCTVPEPSSVTLCLTAGIGLVAWRKRRGHHYLTGRPQCASFRAA